MEVKWIKITTNIFDDEKILLIESLPSADSILVIWFKLLTLAGKQNNCGVFMLSDRIAYTDEMLATIFRRDVNVVRLALNTFEQFGMIEVTDGVISIPNWEKHQSLDKMEKLKEDNRLRQQKHREKMLAEKSNVTVTLRNAIDIDIDKDKEKNKTLSKDKDIRHKHGEYNNVLLTDEELEKLKAEFTDWQERIERLSEYIASTGKSYKSHLATIRSWAKKDKPQKESSFDTDDFFAAALKRSHE